MTNLKGIWPVMTLFYDYNMLSFVGIFDTEIFDICFSKSSKQVHKIIISKDFIWLSYNIHFVSAIIIIIIFPLIMQQWIWKLQHPLPSPVTTGFWSSSKPKGGGGGGEGGDWKFAWLALGNLNQKCQDFPLECTCYISFNVEVFKVDSALSPAKGSETKVHKV